MIRVRGWEVERSTDWSDVGGGRGARDPAEGRGRTKGMRSRSRSKSRIALSERR